MKDKSKGEVILLDPWAPASYRKCVRGSGNGGHKRGDVYGAKATGLGLLDCRAAHPPANLQEVGHNP